METISGIVNNVVYHNDQNGYTVLSIATDEDLVTCTGYLPEIREGENVEFTGEYKDHIKYGIQFNIKTYKTNLPSSLAGVERYLSSGIIKGIGETTAKRIVAKFGISTFDVLESAPHMLAQIKGISLKKALAFSASFNEQSALRHVLLFLHEHNISAAYAKKIVNQYKDATIEIIRNNPYRLAIDIDGIGFKIADSIAYRLGVAHDAPERITAAIRHILWEAAYDGHIYLLQDELIRQVRTITNVAAEIIENELINMQIKKIIIKENDEIFLTPLYHSEISVARRLMALANVKPLDKPLDIVLDIELSEGQKDAVIASFQGGVLVITGGPGTGKTTVITTIIHLLESKGLEIELAAPTGRAAKRMSEATGRKAKTVHRLLEVTFLSNDAHRQQFNKNEDNPLEADVVIIDEASMLDIMLTNNLLKAIAPGTRLIFVGDIDQLPSVGAGNVLGDIIESGTVNVIRLTEIFRQAAKSAIILNAHRINKGKMPIFGGQESDFFIASRTRMEDVPVTIADIVTRRLPENMNIDINDIQVLTPMRKSIIGVEGLNTLLQMKINPPSVTKAEWEFGSTIFREGDKVMQIKNNYDLPWELIDENGIVDKGSGVFNGDIGIIHSIDPATGQITVQYDDVFVKYENKHLEELELAYAVTVHKSQGSEYKCVVIPIYSGPYMLMTRNLLYTAVTRAKSLCIIVGTEDAVQKMIDNNRITQRNTALKKRLVEVII